MEPEAPVRVAHALPGRVRLRAPLLTGARAASERVARALAAEGAYAKVTVRPATGSIILEDDERPLDPPAIAAHIAELIRDERDDDGHPLTLKPPEEHPGPTRIARAVAHATAGINADIRTALDDRADLGTILPVFFAAAGLTEVVKHRTLPVPTWFNLLWWSLRSFMTFNIRAVEDEVHEGEGDVRPLDAEAL